MLVNVAPTRELWDWVTPVLREWLAISDVRWDMVTIKKE
jgi:hypothetical protein